MAGQVVHQRELRTVPTWKYPGWHQALVGFTHYVVTMGFYLYGWSIFVPVLMKNYGWTAALVAMFVLFGRTTAGVEGPITGWLLDKYGPRMPVLLGFVTAAIGWVMVATIPSEGLSFIWVLIGYGILVNFGMNMAGTMVSYPVMTRWFVQRLGLATTIVTLGGGVGGMLLLPVVAWTTINYGYQAAAWVIVATTVVIMMPIALVFKKELPEHYGYYVDNIPVDIAEHKDDVASAAVSKVKVVDIPVKEALRTRGFWMATIGTALCLWPVMALPTYQNVRMQSVGIEMGTAAAVYSLNLGSTIVGRAIMAYLGDRFDIRWLLAFMAGAMTVGLGFFAWGTELWMYYAWAPLFGIPYGAWVVAMGVQRGAFFGRADIGKITGWMSFVTGFASMPAPIVLGWLIDTMGSYGVPFQIYTGIMGLGFISYIFASRPKRQPSQAAIRAAAKEAELKEKRGPAFAGN